MIELVPFSELARVNPPLTAALPSAEASVSFIPMADVSDEGQWDKRRTRRLGEVGAGYTSFQENDVLFAKITPCMENGKGCHARDLINGVGFGSTEFHVLRARGDASPRFVFHWSRFGLLRQQAECAMTGSAGQQRVEPAFFDRFSVPCLQAAEQGRVAEVLDTLDTVTQRTEALVAKLGQIKAGLLSNLLTLGVNADGNLRDPQTEPFKESSSGLLPGNWEVTSLANIASVERGRFAHRPRNDPRLYGGEFPFAQTGDVAGAGGEVLHLASQTLNEMGAATSREFPARTVAITIAANIGDTAILGRPMFLPDSVVGAIAIPPNDPGFLALVLMRLKPHLKALAPQSAQANINLEILRPLLVPKPPPREQARIAEVYFQSVERLHSEESQLSKLRALKRGLAEDLLTGRVRVKV